MPDNPSKTKSIMQSQLDVDEGIAGGLSNELLDG